MNDEKPATDSRPAWTVALVIEVRSVGEDVPAIPRRVALAPGPVFPGRRE